MRVLWVTAEIPDPRLFGGSIRQHHLLNQLARDVHVDLLLLGQQLGDAPVKEALASVCELATLGSEAPRSRLPVRLRTLINAIYTGPEEHRAAQGLRSQAAAWIAAQRRGWDVICVEHASLAGLRKLLPSVPATWVLGLQHLPSLQSKQAARVAASRRAAWAYLREARQLAALQRSWVAEYDVVVAVSTEDAQQLGTSPLVIPNGVDTAEYMATPLPANQHVLFVGHLGYPPNVDGLSWFVETVWPQVLRDAADASLTIAGRSPHPQIAALASHDSIRIVANPDRIAPLLQATRCAVVPLRVGSGTRLKALEAMAAGRPLIGTSIGLTGLGLESGIHAWVEDSPTDMARAIIAVLSDDDTANSTLQEARELVTLHNSWDLVSKDFSTAIKALGAARTERR